MNKTSTDRVRQYRQRQRDASRKLVRLYLDADASDMLAKLAHGLPQTALAEALLTTAIMQACAGQNVRLQSDAEPDGTRHGVPEPVGADTTAIPLFPGRRRRG